MGDFNAAQGGRFQALPAPGFVTVIHAVAAHTKGNYVELVSSTSFDWKGFALLMQSDVSGAGPTTSLTDIAIGGAGSEVDLLSNVMTSPVVSTITLFSTLAVQYIPIGIPAGTRISARGQDQSASSLNTYVGLVGFAGGFPSTPVLGRATTLGANTTTTRGVAVTSGGSSNAKGNWAEITASTSFAIKYLIVMGARQLGNFSVDIGIGAAAAEVIIVPDVFINTYVPMTNCWPVSIPAGTRLSARCSFLGGSGQTLDVTLIGIG